MQCILKFWSVGQKLLLIKQKKKELVLYFLFKLWRNKVNNIIFRLTYRPEIILKYILIFIEAPAQNSWIYNSEWTAAEINLSGLEHSWIEVAKYPGSILPKSPMASPRKRDSQGTDQNKNKQEF